MEADENSGKAFGGQFGHGGGSNEDPAHEASESPQREAQENEAGNGSQAPASVPAPSSPLS
jgi:hypothetical protein